MKAMDDQDLAVLSYALRDLAERFESRGDAAMDECSTAEIGGVTWYDIAEEIEDFARARNRAARECGCTERPSGPARYSGEFVQRCPRCLKVIPDRVARTG